MFTNHASSLSRHACKMAVIAPLALTLWAAPHTAQAQDATGIRAPFEQQLASLHTLSADCKGGGDASSIAGQVLGFFNTGGYWLTGNGSRYALFGSPKFYNSATIYARPKAIGGLELSGGAETMLLSDHFVPFTGGNEYDLLGASAMLSTPSGSHRLRAYVSAGLFYGRLRSVNLGIDHSTFIPSGSVGIEYPLDAHFSLASSYRISQNISGVNTDGLSISLKIH